MVPIFVHYWPTDEQNGLLAAENAVAAKTFLLSTRPNYFSSTLTSPKFLILAQAEHHQV